MRWNIVWWISQAHCPGFPGTGSHGGKVVRFLCAKANRSHYHYHELLLQHVSTGN